MLEKDVRDFFFNTKENYNIIAAEKELNIDNLRIDIFAVDSEGNPFIIEFKKGSNRHIVGQSSHYLALLSSSKHKAIENKLKYFNINWANLKVLCIAKSFNQRDFDALDYEPIKGRVFLYEYSIILDYRKKAIVGLEFIYKGAAGSSPLHLPLRPGNEIDFIEHFEVLTALEGRERKRQYYTDNILWFLQEVSELLDAKYNVKGLYTHISYFISGPHVMFRLGLDKKQSHRASVTISFQEDLITIGFDITHALPDANKLVEMIKSNSNKIAKKILTLKDYYILVPNSGISQDIYIYALNLKGINLILENYQPKIMRDCYFRIGRDYAKDTMSKKEIMDIFKKELETFNFLLEGIRNWGK